MQLIYTEIVGLGAELAAITPQLGILVGDYLRENPLAFPVLTDHDNLLARQFGLVYHLPEKLVTIYKGFGIDLQAANGNDHGELPLPATYVVDEQGVILYAHAAADYTERADPNTILAVLQKHDGGGKV